MTTGIVALLLLSMAALAATPPSLELVHFYDEDGSSLNIIQIEFPSAARGIAIGFLNDEEGRRSRPVSLITADGGKTWTTNRLPNEPVSLFCLDETACWLVGEDGVWFSAETGREWKRLSKQKPLTHVYFRDRERGWGVGAERKLVETTDGGRNWTDIKVAGELTTSEDRTVFHAVGFLSPTRGIIAGRVEPRRNMRIPIWMQAEPEHTRELPSLSILLQTTDGGATWKPSTTSMFGRITRIRPNAAKGYSLALLEFDYYFTYPSEIYRIDNQNGDTKRALRRQTIAITDIAVMKDGSALAVGFEPPGSLARTPVPGKVRVLRSSDLAEWTDLSVDYRAVAHRVSADVAPDGTAWFATDTGMILRYSPAP